MVAGRHLQARGPSNAVVPDLDFAPITPRRGDIVVP